MARLVLLLAALLATSGLAAAGPIQDLIDEVESNVGPQPCQLACVGTCDRDGTEVPMLWVGGEPLACST